MPSKIKTKTIRMRLFIITISVLLLGLTACDDTKTANEETSTDVVLNNTIDSVSYAYGLIDGSGLYKEGIEVNPALVAKGFAVGMSDDEGMMDLTEANNFLRVYFGNLQRKSEIEALSKAEENRKIGEAYMLENAKKSGIQGTESGLQYEVLKSGNGKTPTINDAVTVHYHGTLIDGTVFDSSVERGKPIDFQLTQVIRGWTEILQLMKEGDKWKVTIPAHLAYGNKTSGPIPPGSTLIFEIELIKVNGKK